MTEHAAAQVRPNASREGQIGMSNTAPEPASAASPITFPLPGIPEDLSKRIERQMRGERRGLDERILQLTYALSCITIPNVVNASTTIKRIVDEAIEKYGVSQEELNALIDRNNKLRRAKEDARCECGCHEVPYGKGAENCPDCGWKHKPEVAKEE